MPGSNVFLKPYKAPGPIHTTVPEVHAQKVTEENSKVDLMNKIGYYSCKSFLNS